MPVFKKGSKGKDVEAIQEALNKEIKAGLDVSGVFDRDTEASVRKFQKKKSLKVDGLVGDTTMAILGLIKVKVAKVKVVDAKNQLSYWKTADSLQGVGGPEHAKREYSSFQKALKEIDKEMGAHVKSIEDIQKEVMRRHGALIPVLEQIAKLQADHGVLAKSDPVRANNTAAEIESLNNHFKNLETMFSKAQRKQMDVFLNKMIPLIDKTLA